MLQDVRYEQPQYSISNTQFKFLFNLSFKIRHKETYIEIIDFINAKEFNAECTESFEIRKMKFVTNLKAISCIYGLGCSAIVSFFFVSPLTDTQKAFVFEDDEMYLYWLMVLHIHVVTVLSSFLAMSSSFLMYDLISSVSTEFKVLGTSFNKLLSAIEDDLSEERAIKVLEEMQNHIKYYQKLLK
jgi:hypothetical protein